MEVQRQVGRIGIAYKTVVAGLGGAVLRLPLDQADTLRLSGVAVAPLAGQVDILGLEDILIGAAGGAGPGGIGSLRGGDGGGGGLGGKAGVVWGGMGL